MRRRWQSISISLLCLLAAASALANFPERIFKAAENQLTNVTVAGKWRSDFVYDALNRRRITRDYTWSGSAWGETNEIHYIYDRHLVIQERDTNNNVLVTYTRGRDLGGSLQGAGGIGGLLARTDGNGSAFYHADGSGNITALIDSRENIVARYEYDPYGNTLAMSGTNANANRYRFSSKEIHPNSGLYYYGFRFYSPNLQRWINRDPIQERGGINLYRFVRNNPLIFLDKFGLQEDTLETKNENGEWRPECFKTPEEIKQEQALDDALQHAKNEEFGPQEPSLDASSEPLTDQTAQQKAQDAAQKAAEAVKLPDNQGSEGDNALPKTAKSPKTVPCPPRGSANPNTRARANRGSTLHSDKPGNLPDQLRNLYPETTFQFTKPGQPGQDVKVTDGMHPSAYPNSTWEPGKDYGDFKPDTPGGYKTFNNDQANKWSDPTQIIPYNPNTGTLK